MPATREQRQVGRALSRLESQRVVGLAELEVKAELQAVKAEAVGYVGKSAMQTVALISQLEVQLGQMVPAAVTRLQGIADMTALGVAEVVAESVRKLR